MNFVFVSLQRVNTDRESTSTSLAKELAKTHNVLYVNPPIDRKTWFSKYKDKYTEAHINLIKENKAGLTNPSGNLWVLNSANVLESINWIPFTSVFSFFNKINNKRFAGDIRKALKALKFESFILINDKDIFRSYYLKDLLKPQLYIYLDRDYTLGFGYWKRHGTKLEPELMKKSDAVVCNSLDFTKRAALYNPHSYYIGNGVDLRIFDILQEWNVPEELKPVPKPIIGYVGALNAMRLDINLIAAIADRKNNWSIVLIGDEDDTFKSSVLHEKENVYFIRRKHTAVIPAFVKYFDVCINPQVVNEITIGNFPLKIVEYLAMGRPVVATTTNTMKEVFSEYTFLADTEDEFIHLTEQALAVNSVEEQGARVKFAQNFSWNKVVDNLMIYINRLLT